ncbi:hypothetical protein J4727_09445 [Providencia rettgeri]|uniref:Uncharacterized protein n=1 Tax=Providencia rettgeri TaxID=587 RepID=A0A939NC96_PRORE|nr:hypothetical protein [Providencia rettgeri]
MKLAKRGMAFKPERAKTFEFGYSRNLQGFLGAERHADVKNRLLPYGHRKCI